MWKANLWNSVEKQTEICVYLQWISVHQKGHERKRHTDTTNLDE